MKITKLSMNIFLLVLEIALIVLMISFSMKENYSPFKTKPEYKVNLKGVEIGHFQQEFNALIKSNYIEFDPRVKEVKFPRCEGEVFISGKKYNLSINNGRIFLEKWGLLKGMVKIENESPEVPFLIKGKDIKIDFKRKLLSSQRNVLINTSTVNAKGKSVVVDLSSKIIKLSGGVSGEIKNFTP